jgi:hypothetical protein
VYNVRLIDIDFKVTVVVVLAARAQRTNSVSNRVCVAAMLRHVSCCLFIATLVSVCLDVFTVSYALER